MPKRDPEKVKEYNREYYKRNKESILKQQKEKNLLHPEIRRNIRLQPHVIEKAKEPLLCEICNVYIQRKSMSGHKKTKCHLKKANNE